MPNGNVSIFQHVYPELKYALSDMVPLATVCSFDFGLAVGSGSMARTLKEFIDGAKAKPGHAAYGTPGPGTAMHFMGVMLAKNAGFEFTPISFRGGAAAMTDVMGGMVPALATTVPNLIGPTKDGKLRTLAVSSEQRLKSLPDVPTFRESGFPDLVISKRFGFFASAKVPEAVQAELEQALMAAASKPRVVAALEKLEFDSVVKGRAHYLALMKSDVARWGPVVKASGYKAEDWGVFERTRRRLGAHRRFWRLFSPCAAALWKRVAMPRRHVLILMSDERDPRHTGCSGSPLVKTPHLDALAARGTRFAQAYRPGPNCVPARAAFATGHRVHRTRHWDNASPYSGQPLGWGHVLQSQGIRVESVAKLHYRAEEDPAGFDAEHLSMHGLGGYGVVWASIRDPCISQPGGRRMLGQNLGAGEPCYTRYDAAVTQRSMAWLQQAGRQPGQPFVLSVGRVAPHFPLLAPRAFSDLYPPHSLPQPKLHPDTGYVRHPWVQACADFSQNEASFHSADERLAVFSA